MDDDYDYDGDDDNGDYDYDDDDDDNVNKCWNDESFIDCLVSCVSRTYISALLCMLIISILRL